MGIKETIKSYSIKELQKELDPTCLKEAVDFIDSQLNSEKMRAKIAMLSEILEKNGLGEKEFYILHLILLGLGRNRTCNAMEDFSVDRADFEKVRDLCGLKNDSTKKENEKYITSLKWKSKRRKERKDMISDSIWFKIKKEYISGESPVKIGEKYGVSGHIISQRLRDEGIFDELRSTFTKNKIAEEEINNVENKFFIDLMEKYDSEPIYNIWRIAQQEYPWLLRRQFLSKLKELGLERSEEEVNSLKIEKSKVSQDNSFEIKKYLVDTVNELFGSVKKMTEKYLNNEIGSYREIASFINDNNKRKIMITERQVYRLISNNANFRKTKSSEQDSLYKEIVNLFPDMDVFEEVKFAENNKKVDIYIPEIKLAIDYNGDYWHSNSILSRNTGVPAYFHHRERVETMKDEGVKLIYVWSSDWNNNSDEILNLIKERNWENEILNQYESPSNAKGSLELHKKIVQEQIIKVLKDAGYENNFEFNNDKMTIKF